MSFPRYERYKDSGVEWLGEVPEHWNISKFRHVFSESSEKIEDQVVGEMLSVSGYRGIEIKKYEDENQRRLEENLVGYRVVRVGQLVVNTMWLNYAGLGVSALEGHVSPAYRAYWINESLNKRFIHHLMRSEFYVRGYTKYLTGVRPNSLQMSRDDLMVFPIVVPSPTEQEAISMFLDRETAKIDALIEEQRRLIELLKEKRQAFISHAVTKGLDPHVDLKDSGFEWLGSIPAHWEVGSIKRWFQTSSGGTPSTSDYDRLYTTDGGYPWIRTTDINDEPLQTYEVAITEDGMNASACSLLPVGCVLIAMYGGGGTIGKNAILEIPACINQALCALLPNHDFIEEFTFRFVQFYKPYWMIGAVSSRIDPNISQDLIKNSPVVRPPLEEQLAIAHFLSEKIDRFNQMQREAVAGISFLDERRSALISAAVTGKIDVRNYTPKEAA